MNVRAINVCKLVHCNITFFPMYDKIEKCSVSSNASKHFQCNCYVVLDGKNIFGCFRYSSSSLTYKQGKISSA